MVGARSGFLSGASAFRRRILRRRILFVRELPYPDSTGVIRHLRALPCERKFGAAFRKDSVFVFRRCTEWQASFAGSSSANRNLRVRYRRPRPDRFSGAVPVPDISVLSSQTCSGRRGGGLAANRVAGRCDPSSELFRRAAPKMFSHEKWVSWDLERTGWVP